MHLAPLVIAKSVFSGTGRRLVSLQTPFLYLLFGTSKMSVWSTLSDSSFLEMLDSVLSKCDASYCKFYQNIAAANIRFFLLNNGKMIFLFLMVIICCCVLIRTTLSEIDSSIVNS